MDLEQPCPHRWVVAGSVTHRNFPAKHFFYTTANTLRCICFTVPNRLDNVEKILNINVFNSCPADFRNRLEIGRVPPLLLRANTSRKTGGLYSRGQPVPPTVPQRSDPKTCVQYD